MAINSPHKLYNIKQKYSKQMNISKKQIYIFIIVVLLLISVGYYFRGSSVEIKSIPEAGKPLIVTRTISIGTVGDNAVNEIKLFQPTVDYIAASLGDDQTEYKGEVKVAKNMEAISDLLKEQKLDLYVDSPFPAIIIARKSGMVPFLRRWKDGVPVYHTVFIVKNDSTINSSNDFNGKTIASEDEGSTTSYLMPKIYLIQKGFNVNQTQDNSIRFVFTGGKQNTPIWVIERKADIGAMNNLDFEKIPPNIKSELRVIERTIDLPRHIVSHRPDMDPATVEKIRRILINMDKDPEGIEILKNFQNTKKYDPISMDEISDIGKIVGILDK